MVELLAPAGNRAKLNTAFHFGADAVYIGGGEFGLRAYADNFDDVGLKDAVAYAHSIGKKVYVTVNIFASNKDFVRLEEYLKFLSAIGTDAVIITDAGVIELCKRAAPDLSIHLSTQANTTNGYSARFWAEQGVGRIVLARELSVDEIAEIRDIVGDSAELEVFVHGAMCISYSGRCLLSSYLTDRDSNRGECVQACRWEYLLAEKNRTKNPLTITEDARGSYILNSKDLNMLGHIDKLIKAGVDCFKIEGRMKSEHYVGSVVNAYRRAINGYYNNPKGYISDKELEAELYKTGNRGYTTGFFLGKEENVSFSGKPAAEYLFVAEVISYDKQTGLALIEQRNRFREGDSVEVLSPGAGFNKRIRVEEMFDTEGNRVSDAKLVQQKLYLKTDILLEAHDILRKGGGK